MKSPRRQLAFTLVWIVGALLFAFGRPAFFGGAAGRSTPPTIAVGVAPAALGSTSTTTSTDALIHTLQRRALSNDDVASYNNLAQAYMQKARETGDVTYYNLADQAVNHSLALGPHNYEGLATAAWVRLARHDFRGSVALAQQSIKINPYHSETYGILGDAQAELGDYAGATKSYQRMIDLRPDLPSYDRASHMHWLYGETAGAIQLMQMAIKAGGTFAENIAWCQSQLADDYFFLGSPKAAEAEYLVALRTFPHDIYALSGLGRLYAGQGRFQKAVSYYRQAIAQVPLPQYVIGLGDTYARMGQTAQARAQYKLVDFIFHLYDVNHINVGIDRAQFYADHDMRLAEALRLAKAEATWRHDIRTMDILAWAYYKNHQYVAAAAAERQAIRLGTRDAGTYYHMGMIDAALGDTVGAKAYLQGALLLNPIFDVRQAPVAIATLRCLESLPPPSAPAPAKHSSGGHISVGVGTGN